MNEAVGGTWNIAGGAAGVQAGGDVHDSNVYMGDVRYVIQPDDPPEKRYAVGIRHLEENSPSRARDLIREAIARRYDGSEVRFHQVLAVLSGRADRDLTADERRELDRTEERLNTLGNDKWKQALEVIFELRACQRDRRRDPGDVLEKKLRSLDDVPRDKIVRHLDHVLTGSLKDSFWAEMRQSAYDNRVSGNRHSRVWAYFEPDPIGPRTREPARERTTPDDRILAVLWSLLLAGSAGYLGWLVLSLPALLPVVAYPLALAAGYVAARTGLEWRYRWQRRLVKDHEYFGRPGINPTPAGGFADSVGNRFDHYFATYVPGDVNRDDWLAATVGIKRTLRDEIVELYRESRVGVARVNWLIRHLVVEIEQQWEDGTLWQYGEQHRVAPSTKIWCSVSLGVLIPATLIVIVTAARTALLPASFAAFVLLLSGIKTTMRWFDIICERRRLREEQQECVQRMYERETAYQRWTQKLRDTRPTEDEMATWLSCDMTLLLDKALKHYGLPWRDVLEHAFLRKPSKGCQRNRVRHGPWRYSRYDVWLFLITQDGVREFRTELDFREIAFHGQETDNYRFDAVSSVSVVKTGEYSHELTLALTNGDSHTIHVTGVEPLDAEPDESEEDSDMLATMNLETAGFPRTMHILEGIAADGKGWIDRTPVYEQ